MGPLDSGFELAEEQIRLVHGCELRLAPGWETCRPGLCRERPCWVACVSEDGAWVLPLGKDTWRSPVVLSKNRYRLVYDSALQFEPVLLPIAALGHRVNAIGRLDLIAELLAVWPAVLSYGFALDAAARWKWHAVVSLIRGDDWDPEAAP